MFYYIYDSFLSEKRHERMLTAVEARLADLGISGKVGRLTPFTNARGLIRDETRRGTNTIIVVGNDESVAKVVEGIGDAEITLGIIPIGMPQLIAESLGIPEGIEACDILSKRVTQKIDLGKVNGKFFLSNVRIPSGKVTIEGEGRYRISPQVADCEIMACNLRSADMVARGQAERVPGDPMDGFLDALIIPKTGSLFGFGKKKGGATVIPFKRLHISGEEPMEVVADGRVFMNNDISIEVVPACLKVITGRERVFS